MFLGVVTGGSFAQLGLRGSTLSGDLSTASADWDGVAVQLRKLSSADTTHVYAGSTINETLGLGGLWSASVDANGDGVALFAYPTLGFVSEVQSGRVDANGTVNWSGPHDVGQGRLENGLAAGRWTARDGSQQGSWQGSVTPGGQPIPRGNGIAGAWVGRYRSTAGVADEGLLGVVIYPDATFLAVAVSTTDPLRRDVGLGAVAPDGVPTVALTWGGTTVTSGSLIAGGTYQAPDHAGTFDLRRAAGDELHAGVFVDAAFSLPGTWIAIADGQGGVAGLTAYPTLLAVGDGAWGTLDGNGTLQASTASGDRADGRFEQGMSGGTWVDASGVQRGWWTGFRLQ